MTYNSNSHINTVQDVEVFFHHLLADRKVNFHPDDDFENYVSRETGNDTFTKEECAMYNRLMEESFEVCEQAGEDIYSVGLDEFLSMFNQ